MIFFQIIENPDEDSLSPSPIKSLTRTMDDGTTVHIKGEDINVLIRLKDLVSLIVNPKEPLE